jgi:hypothetical protein
MLNKPRSFILFVFILGVILFLGLIFSTWVIPNIIQPAAETVWLFLRMFILSVDQGYYWYLVAAAGTIWIIYRLTRRGSSPQPVQDIIHNETLSSIQEWSEALTFSNQSGSQKSVLRSKILRLIVSHYEARQQSSTELEIRQAIEKRQLLLPTSVYKYLYLPGSQPSHSSFWQIIRHSLNRWHNRVTGKDAAEFNQMIDELIEFIKQ